MAHIFEAPVLQISRFYSGLITFRNPLIVPIKQMGRRVIELYDALIAGVNMEITNTLTLKRRPGYSAYNSNAVSGIPQAFYSFKPSSFPGAVYPIVDTTTEVEYVQPGSPAISPVLTKTTARQTNFAGIGPYLYMGNPSFSQKWDGPTGPQGVTNWGIAISSQSNATGPNAVGTGANSGTGTWTNPGNITVQDAAFATNSVTGVVSGTVSTPGFLQGTNCGFAIPNTTVITGILVEVKGLSSAGGSQYRPTTSTGNYTSPALAYDNNLATGAVGTDGNMIANPKQASWSGFPAGPGAPVSVTLNISSQVSGNSSSGGEGKLEYSINNGASRVTIYDVFSPRSKTTDSISLSLAQNFTQVLVYASATGGSSGTGAVNSTVYEIWIDAPTAVSGNASAISVNLIKSGAVVGNTETQIPGTVNSFMTFGGPTDLWGTTWSPLDINAANFGAALVASVTNLVGVVNFSIDFVRITVYGLGGPTVALVAGTLTAQNGFQYVFCYGNSKSGHVSSPTPPSNVIKPVAQGVQISLVASTDPQVDQIRVFRTTDGGGQPFFELPTSPYPNTTQNVVDNAPDNTLQIANICPLPHFNDPPPTGLVDPVWFSGRLWGHVANALYFSSGPDITMGNQPEAWFPVYVFTLPTTIIRKFPLPNGMLVVTVDDIYVVRGIDTTSFTVNEFMRDIGMRSWNAGDSDGSNIYIYTNDRQTLLINANGIQSISSNISDVVDNVDPSSAYMTIFRYTARNTMLFLSDGHTSVYPYNLQQEAWCPIQTPTGGVQAIGAIETQLGVWQMLRGKNLAGQTVAQRDITSFTDEGTPYTCTATFGPIPVADMLMLAQVKDLAVATAAGGSAPTIGVLANEVTGTFQNLGAPTSTEPPELSATPSTSFTANRYSLQQTSMPELMNFIFIQMSWPAASTADELLAWALAGTQTTGGSALGPAGKLPELQGR